MKKLFSLISILSIFTTLSITTFALAVIEEEPDTVTYTPEDEVILTGYTSLSGYMKKGEMLNEDQQKLYFLITNYGSENYKKAIEDFYNNGEEEILKIDDHYAIKIGCHSKKYNEIESPQYNIGKNDPAYWKIFTSSKEAQASLQVNVHLEDWMFNVEKDCLALVDNYSDTKEDYDYPYGKHAVEGYYIKEKDILYDQTYEQGYFVTTKYLDTDNVKQYFGEKINEGNTVNGKFEDNNYKISLGCIEDDSVGTYWYKIDGSEYKTLINSHKGKKIKANIYMGAMPETDGPCISLINNFELEEITQESADTFPDVTTTHTNHDAVEDLYKKEIINGNPDGTFLPENPINRAELIKMVVEMMADTPDEEKYKNCFPDVTNEWYAKYVCYAQKFKWIEGYPDGNFKPEKSTDRAEAAKIVLNAFYNGKIPQLLAEVEASLNMPEDAYKDQWYYKFIKYGIGKNLFDMHHIFYEFDNSYQYKLPDNITRKEVAEFIYRLMAI